MKVKIINKSGFELPRYETEGAAGFDLRATVDKTIVLAHGERALIDTGLYVSIPKGYELQIRPRSGLAIKQGITVLNSPGTVDSDFRNEIKIILINLSYGFFKINSGDRIAQGIISPIIQAEWEEVEELDTTIRGLNGFGSTGIK